MEVKRELYFDDLGRFFWAGAKNRWDDATDDQKERVWDLLQEVFMDEIPTETEVNDFVWFECDDIFNEEDDEMDESVCRKRNIRKIIEKKERIAEEYFNHPNELPLPFDKYVIMKDVDRYNDAVYDNRHNAIEDAEAIASDGVRDIWVAYIEDQNGRPELMMEWECEYDDEDEDDEEFESVRRRRNLRRVIESRRARAKKESLRCRITNKFENKDDKYLGVEYSPLDNKELWEDAIKTVTRKKGKASIDKTNKSLFITLQIPTVGKFFLEVLPSTLDKGGDPTYNTITNIEIRMASMRDHFGTPKLFSHKENYNGQLPGLAEDFVYDCLEMAGE